MRARGPLISHHESAPDWKYILPHRSMMCIEELLDQALVWAVFEPNLAARQGLTRRCNACVTRTERFGRLG
jgi:hypothetical protein